MPPPKSNGFNTINETDFVGKLNLSMTLRKIHVSTTRLTKQLTIDTTAVYYIYNCSFGKTKSFRSRCRVKFGAQHTPLSQRFSELVKKHTLFPQNQHFSYLKRCTALRTALPEKSTISHRFLFTHRYTADQGVPPPGGGTGAQKDKLVRLVRNNEPPLNKRCKLDNMMIR